MGLCLPCECAAQEWAVCTCPLCVPLGLAVIDGYVDAPGQSAPSCINQWGWHISPSACCIWCCIVALCLRNTMRCMGVCAFAFIIHAHYSECIRGCSCHRCC